MAGINESLNVDDLLKRVVEQIMNLPEPKSLSERREFTAAGVDAMDALLKLGKIAVCLQRPKTPGYAKRHAPLIGLMVRMVKLVEGFLDHIVKDKGELAIVFIRPLYEAHIKFEYLLRSGPQSVRSFMIASFRPEKEMLAHLNSIKKQRPFKPIETRMQRSILNHLKLIGVSQKQLLAQTNWEIDGKSFRALLQTLKRDLEYSFNFGSSSHFVHGTWCDLWLNHLQRKGTRYFPEIRYTESEPRLLISVAVLLANSLTLFIGHFRLDPKGSLREPIGAVWEYMGRFFNEAFETTLAQKTRPSP